MSVIFDSGCLRWSMYDIRGVWMILEIIMENKGFMVVCSVEYRYYCVVEIFFFFYNICNLVSLVYSIYIFLGEILFLIIYVFITIVNVVFISIEKILDLLFLYINITVKVLILSSLLLWISCDYYGSVK